MTDRKRGKIRERGFARLLHQFESREADFARFTRSRRLVLLDAPATPGEDETDDDSA